MSNPIPRSTTNQGDKLYAIGYASTSSAACGVAPLLACLEGSLRFFTLPSKNNSDTYTYEDLLELKERGFWTPFVTMKPIEPTWHALFVRPHIVLPEIDLTSYAHTESELGHKVYLAEPDLLRDMRHLWAEKQLDALYQDIVRYYEYILNYQKNVCNYDFMIDQQYALTLHSLENTAHEASAFSLGHGEHHHRSALYLGLLYYLGGDTNRLVVLHRMRAARKGISLDQFRNEIKQLARTFRERACKIQGFTSLGEVYVRVDAPLDAQQRGEWERALSNLNHPSLVAARHAAVNGERKLLERKHASRADRTRRAAYLLAEHPSREFTSIQLDWLQSTLGQAR